jgi:hypothetical protein
VVVSLVYFFFVYEGFAFSSNKLLFIKKKMILQSLCDVCVHLLGALGWEVSCIGPFLIHSGVRWHSL